MCVHNAMTKTSRHTLGNNLKRLCISLLLGANLITIALLWLSAGLTYVSPEHCPRLSLLTLAFPAFFVANAALLCVWVLCHFRLAWVPIAGMLAVAGQALDYWPLHFPSAGSTSADSTLTIVSYNTHYQNTDGQREGLLAFFDSTHADIICLQEITESWFKHKDTKAWLEQHNLHSQHEKGLAIISRYPVLGSAVPVDFPTRDNHSLTCWLNYGGDSLLVINNHLESNKLSEEDKNEYTDMLKNPNRATVKNGVRTMVKKLSEAAGFRGMQADSICAIVSRNAAHPVIVCGDLNDTPVSYTYRRLTSLLQSAYRKAGFGPGFSYSERAFSVRIDHIFFSNRWECHDCRIDQTISLSDHYPLIARLHPKVQ